MNPLGSSIVANDFSVDDLVSGADDVETLIQIRVHPYFKRMRFQLGKVLELQ